MSSREHPRQDRRSSRHSDLFVSGVCVCVFLSESWILLRTLSQPPHNSPSCPSMHLSVLPPDRYCFSSSKPQPCFHPSECHMLTTESCTRERTHTQIIRNPVESFYLLLLLRAFSEVLCVCLWLKSMDLFLSLHLIPSIFFSLTVQKFLNVNNSKQL